MAAVFDRDAEFEFQVAPMADLLFVLLVFFMSITSLDSLRKDRRVALPTLAPSSALEAGALSHQAVLTLGWLPGARAGTLEADGKPLADEAGLLAWLRGRKAADSEVRVVLRIDRNAEYGRTAEIMRVCEAAGIGSVTFAVSLPPEHGKPAR